jgi:hypothetical protein
MAAHWMNCSNISQVHWVGTLGATLLTLLMAGTWTQVCCGAFASGDFTGPSPMVRRWGHSAIASNDEVWLYGGSTQQGTAISSVSRYFPGTSSSRTWKRAGTLMLCAANRTWVSVTGSGTLPAGRWGHTAVLSPRNDGMLIYGGRNSSTYFKDIWLYSFGTPPCVRHKQQYCTDH